MDNKTIDERLVEAARKELQTEIDKTAMDLDQLLRNGGSYTVEMEARTKDYEVAPNAFVMWYEALKALRKTAFDMHIEKRIDEKRTAFLRKICDLGEQIEELRNEISNIQQQ